MLVIFLFLGVMGVAFSFDGLSSVISYFSSADARFDVLSSPLGLTGVLGLVLRPFLGFAFMGLWCRRIDRQMSSPKAVQAAAIAAGVALFVLLTYGTYNYNRAAFAAPLVALAATFSARVRRLGWVPLVAVGLMGLLFLTGVRVYRSSALSVQDILGSASARQTLSQDTDLNDELQVYAGSPQFLAFLMANSGESGEIHWGYATLSSTLSPVPKLGEPYRQGSSTAIYNRMVYGNAPFRDQAVSFQGELYLDFRVPGVILGFVLMGVVMAGVQRRFAMSVTSIELLAWQYMGIWISFLVVGGLGIVSQILIYFFGPVYVFLLLAPRTRQRVSVSTHDFGASR